MTHRKLDEIVFETIFAGCFIHKNKNVHLNWKLFWALLLWNKWIHYICGENMRKRCKMYCSFPFVASQLNFEFCCGNFAKSYCWWVFCFECFVFHLLSSIQRARVDCNSCSQQPNTHFAGIFFFKKNLHSFLWINIAIDLFFFLVRIQIARYFGILYFNLPNIWKHAQFGIDRETISAKEREKNRHLPIS